MTREESVLKPYRMIDLTDGKGYLCGKIFADLGADVIKVEPPGGEPGRKIGSFYKDIPDPEKSLFWFGIIMTINMEMALITPPVGLNVFVIKGIARDTPISTIFRGVLPFVLILASVIVLIALVPDIALWLPGMMMS